MMPEDALVDRVVRRVMERLQRPQVMLEASGRHVHLTRQAVETLFGKGYRLTKAADLSQPGQYACKERLRAKGPKGEFSNVVVLGPERDDNQLEISLTDALTLGIKAPVRLSGSIAHTPGVLLVGPRGEVEIARGVIAAKRHIHMTPQDARQYGLQDQQVVSVCVPGERSVTFHNVALRVSDTFATYMHIDYDEANACGFEKGMMGSIIV